MSLLVAIIWLLIYALVIGLIFYLVIWVLRDILGLPVPLRAIQIVGAILVLLLLLWFLSVALTGGALPVPRWG